MTSETNSTVIEPSHEATLDGTGMYPLRRKIAFKTYLITLLIPAAVIHLLVFFALQAFLKRFALSDLALSLASGLPALFLSSLYLFIARKADWREQGLKFFTRYERGRRFVIGTVISWTGAIGFLYFVFLRWGILTLAQTHAVLALGLIVGNLILIRLDYELSSYIMFGVLTWIVSVLSFSIADRLVLASPLGAYAWSWNVSQTISFILAVLFAFVTNRLFVFSSRSGFWRDMLGFFSGRILATLVFEYGTLFVMINLLKQNRELAKFIGSFLVTIANYFISKYFVFRTSKAGNPPQ